MNEPTKLHLSSSRSGIIRGRLLGAFILVVMLPIAAISLVLAISGTLGERDRLQTELQTANEYKVVAITTWTDGLKTELAQVLRNPSLIANIADLSSPDAALTQQAKANLRTQLKSLQSQSHLFESLFIVNTAGKVVQSSDAAQEGQDFSSQPMLKHALDKPYINPPYYSRSLRKRVLIAVYPVIRNGEVTVLLGGIAKLDRLQSILQERSGLGETGVTYLVSSNSTLLAGLNEDNLGNMLTVDAVAEQLKQPEKPYKGAYTNYQGMGVNGAAYYLSVLDSVLITEQSRWESDRSSAAVMAVTGSVALTSLFIAILMGLSVTRSISEPISSLASTATEIAAGNIRISSDVESEDELGTLAQAFNSMTSQLRNLIDDLEARVTERTAELQKRTLYMEASSQVSQAAANILDPDQLVKEAVELIQEHFNLYYVGLFLVDGKKEWAVLRAGTGQAGQAMLSRNHRLRLDKNSMIGWAITNNQARVALRAGEDVVRLATAELPETRSEAALPLRSRNQVLGAISVQSSQPDAFDAESIALLQSMADQLAVALDNASLFAASEAALNAERRAYGDLSRQAWISWMQGYPSLSFRGDAHGVRAETAWYPEMESALIEGKMIQYADPARQTSAEPASVDPSQQANVLAIPIQVRGVTIGVIDTFKPAGAGAWTTEEIALLQSVTEQLGVALDSARLYSETQEKAEQERMVAEITSQMRQTLDVDSVLQTAASQIFKALGLHDVTIKLRSS